MRRILAIVLAALMLFALCAGCKSEEKDSKPVETANTGDSGQKTDTGSNVQAGAQLAGDKLETVDKEQKVYPSDDAEVSIATKVNFTAMTQFGRAYGSSLAASGIFHETLLGYDIETNDVKPCLAESWEWVDGLTLRFKLYEGINSINGDSFTAKDVVYTLNYNNTVNTLSSYYNIFDYEKTKAVDELTVDVVLKQPYPYLTLDMAHGAYEMVCEKSVEAAGGPEALKDNPIAGTGPYKLVKWEEGVSVRAERRDNYWGQIPYYKYINFCTVGDANTRYMGIEAGDYDVCGDLPTSAVITAQSSDRLNAWSFVHCGRCIQLAINSDANDFLKNKLCRQAIALGINYEAILSVAGSNQGVVPKGGCFLEASPYYAYKEDGIPEDNYYLGKYNPELAKQKLKEAGYPDGYNLVLSVSSGDSTMHACAEMIANNLAQIGIDMDIELIEPATMTSRARNGDFMLRIVGGGNPNGSRGLQTIDPRVGHAAAAGSAGQYWFEGHTLEEISALIDAVKFTPEGPELDAAIRKWEDFMGEYVPKINLASMYVNIITSKDIVGFEFQSMGTPVMTSFYTQEYIDGPAA